MKLFFFAIIFTLLLCNCSSTKKIANGEISNSLLKSDYSSWYNSFYNSYSVDTNTLNKIPTSFNNENNNIEIFMGTWCSDSHREIPRIIKILEYLKFTNYRIFGLDTNIKSKQGFENEKNIIRVPTIVIYKKSEEINRIIEYPIISLENDLLTILNGKKYKPNYTD